MCESIKNEAHLTTVSIELGKRVSEIIKAPQGNCATGGFYVKLAYPVGVNLTQVT